MTYTTLKVKSHVCAKFILKYRMCIFVLQYIYSVYMNLYTIYHIKRWTENSLSPQFCKMILSLAHYSNGQFIRSKVLQFLSPWTCVYTKTLILKPFLNTTLPPSHTHTLSLSLNGMVLSAHSLNLLINYNKFEVFYMYLLTWNLFYSQL